MIHFFVSYISRTSSEFLLNARLDTYQTECNCSKLDFVAVFFSQYSSILILLRFFFVLRNSYVCAVKRRRKKHSCHRHDRYITCCVPRCFFNALCSILLFWSASSFSFSYCPASSSSSSSPLYSTSIHNLSFELVFSHSSFVHVFLSHFTPKTNRWTLCNVPQFLQTMIHFEALSIDLFWCW